MFPLTLCFKSSSCLLPFIKGNQSEAATEEVPCAPVDLFQFFSEKSKSANKLEENNKARRQRGGKQKKQNTPKQE